MSHWFEKFIAQSLFDFPHVLTRLWCWWVSLACRRVVGHCVLTIGRCVLTIGRCVLTIVFWPLVIVFWPLVAVFWPLCFDHWSLCFDPSCICAVDQGHGVSEWGNLLVNATWCAGKVPRSAVQHLSCGDGLRWAQKHLRGHPDVNWQVKDCSVTMMLW